MAIPRAVRIDRGEGGGEEARRLMQYTRITMNCIDHALENLSERRNNRPAFESPGNVK